MKDDRPKPTGMGLPQRVKALMFNEGDIIDKAGRYKFVRKLGKGAMGKVFLFQDTGKMGGPRALKTVDEILNQYPKAVEDLIRECNLMKALTHPNIVTVRDLVMDQWGYRYYIVMDYAEGETLRDYLMENPKPSQAIALKIIRLMAEALDHAHERNIVHADVKPENTMVEIGDKVNSLKLTDFGLSYHIQATTASLGVSSGAVKGTSAYMAPELFELRYGDSPEPLKPGMEVDMYALGTVAYEMLAGRRPFNGPNDIALAHNVIYEEVPEIKELPAPMNAALKKMLAKKPGDRFENCTAFAEALSAAPAPAPIEVTPPPAATPQPSPVIVEKPSPQQAKLKSQSVPAPSKTSGKIAEWHSIWRNIMKIEGYIVIVIAFISLIGVIRGGATGATLEEAIVVSSSVAIVAFLFLVAETFYLKISGKISEWHSIMKIEGYVAIVCAFLALFGVIVGSVTLEEATTVFIFPIVTVLFLNVAIE
ncbi:MAG: serine/threonine protein kinase [Victivallales bacterium]|nr:serine/threonine protein kinase [Victivallales bacterium]